MGRIVYRLEGAVGPRGGHKMVVRHVEALRALGYEAFVSTAGQGVDPTWIAHSAPFIADGEIAPEDVLVVPEGRCSLPAETVRGAAKLVVFCQNHFAAAATGMPATAMRRDPGDAVYMACSLTVARWLTRFVTGTNVGVVTAFADERLFFPRPKKDSFASFPQKRIPELAAITPMASRIYRGQTKWIGVKINGRPEREVAEILGSAAVFVSLSRAEGLGMSTLEAMASGCLVVGFTGIGGLEYATASNGFWVGEDDCEACAEALAKALTLVDERPVEACYIIDEARRTAARYSHRVFAEQLHAFWREHAPQGHGLGPGRHVADPARIGEHR